MKRKTEERASKGKPLAHVAHADCSNIRPGVMQPCIITVIQRQSVSVHQKIMVGPGSLLVPCSPSSSGANATLTPAPTSSPSVSVGGANLTLYDEREVMEEFISCYRHFTALWDSTSVDYLSKFKKEPGYQELLKILRRLNGDSSVQDVKRKINSLRCCYRREIKKVQSSQNGYKPRLWWYHLMDFLKPVLHIQSPVRVKSESLDDSLDETSINVSPALHCSWGFFILIAKILIELKTKKKSHPNILKTTELEYYELQSLG